MQTRTPRCTTQTLEAKPQPSHCSSFYLSLSRGSGELQRAAADVPVVGVEGDERNGGEEREPRREGDAQADQGATLRPPPTCHILCGRTAVRRLTSAVRVEEETEGADGGRTEARKGQTTCAEGKKHGRQVTFGVLGGEGIGSDHASHQTKTASISLFVLHRRCAHPAQEPRRARYFSCERAEGHNRKRARKVAEITSGG